MLFTTRQQQWSKCEAVLSRVNDKEYVQYHLCAKLQWQGVHTIICTAHPKPFWRCISHNIKFIHFNSILFKSLRLLTISNVSLVFLCNEAWAEKQTERNLKKFFTFYLLLKFSRKIKKKKIVVPGSHSRNKYLLSVCLDNTDELGGSSVLPAQHGRREPWCETRGRLAGPPQRMAVSPNCAVLTNEFYAHRSAVSGASASFLKLVTPKNEWRLVKFMFLMFYW